LTFVLIVAIALWSPLPTPGSPAEALANKAGGWSLRAEAIPHVLEVARKAQVDPLVLGSIASQESAGGRSDVMRQCDEWEPCEGGKRCVRESSCWSQCTEPEAWENRLDCGMWGIRDAPPPGSSWVRRYERFHKPLRPKCIMDPGCASRLMVWILQDLKRWTPRSCAPPCVGELAWLSRWNGCASCNRHLARATLKRALMVLLPLTEDPKGDADEGADDCAGG
jgi:hypothetical protein